MGWKGKPWHRLKPAEGEEKKTPFILLRDVFSVAWHRVLPLCSLQLGVWNGPSAVCLPPSEALHWVVWNQTAPGNMSGFLELVPSLFSTQHSVDASNNKEKNQQRSLPEEKWLFPKRKLTTTDMFRTLPPTEMGLGLGSGTTPQKQQQIWEWIFSPTPYQSFVDLESQVDKCCHTAIMLSVNL